jgi:hypothetical protein
MAVEKHGLVIEPGPEVFRIQFASSLLGMGKYVIETTGQSQEI